MSVLVKGAAQLKTADVAKNVENALAVSKDFNVTRDSLTKKLTDWITSQPYDLPGGTKLGSLEPSFGLKDTAPKARWKIFPDNETFYCQLCFEADARVQENASKEVTRAKEILRHAYTANLLNTLRREIGKRLWDKDSWGGWISHYAQQYTPLNVVPNMLGSYNLANSYPKPDNYISWYDYGDDNGTPSDDELAWAAFYNVVVAGLNCALWFSNGLLAPKDRISLAYDSRDFSVAENVAILHDLKELYSPIGNSRALPTWHKIQIPHPYQGEKSPKQAQRYNGEDKKRVLVKFRMRDGKYPNPDAPAYPLKKMDLGNSKTWSEIRWDQGRLGAGTRDENSDDTKTAEANLMPIETGRSHTAARLFEMVKLLDSEKEGDYLKAMAYGVFAYWNAPTEDGGYPKSLTPIHTYHEVMDPLEDYAPGSYANPFTYDDVDNWLKR
jgi:hypothetical protein